MAAQRPQLKIVSEKDPMLRQCAKHPSVETRLSCSHCETPICPKCMIICDVGMKCKQCTTKTLSHVVRAEARDLLLSGVASLVIGLIFGLVISQMIFGFGYFLLVLSFWGGKWAGNLAHRCARFKMARSVLHVMTVCCSLGILLSLMPFLWPLLADLAQNPESLHQREAYPILMQIGGSIAFVFGLQANFRFFR